VAQRDRLGGGGPDGPRQHGKPARALGGGEARGKIANIISEEIGPGAPQRKVPLEPAAAASRTLSGDVAMSRIGVLRTPWGPLDAWWLDEYSGGLFVPVKDRTAGTTTYGAGRYLLDTAKGADLGGAVVLDLNFLYHPSCAYDPAWSCPLAPEGNVLNIAVTVGEVLPP